MPGESKVPVGHRRGGVTPGFWGTGRGVGQGKIQKNQWHLRNGQKHPRGTTVTEGKNDVGGGKKRSI